MKRRVFVTAAGTVSAVASLGALGAFTGAPEPGRRLPAVPGRSAPGADRAALRRILPNHHEQVTFAEVPADRVRPAGSDVDGQDSFRISGGPGGPGGAGAIRIEGTTAAVRLRGLYWYLAHVAGVNLTWAGGQLRLPAKLPAVRKPLEGRANVPHRFVLNDTSDGYTGPYRDWTYWERQIDLFALHGWNEVLVYAGADAAYHRLFQEFGYTDEEVRAWIPGPAHQPWWLLQNMSGFGGPVSAQLLEQRALLGRRIADRLRELGMAPVFPGYFGTVPAGFADRNPGARTVPQGVWAGFPRPDWLDPRTDAFAEVSAAYYRIHGELFGSAPMYKMDLLHEGGKPGDVPVPEAVRAVQSALEKARPGAVWAILGWQKNPTAEVLGAADRSRLLVLDGLSDRFPEVESREKDWLGSPYAFGTIPNFGGHTALGANTADWARHHEWLARSGSTLSGTALMPEAADNDPAAFQLFSELAWRQEPVELAGWFADFARSRYGGEDANAAKAWDILRRTAYGTTRADRWSEPADTLFAARPALDVNRAASWSPKQLRYDAAEFARALPALLAVAPALRDSSAYRRDLTDVTAQCLANESRSLLPRIRRAYEGADSGKFAELTNRWLRLVALLDEIAATDAARLLGVWIAEARSHGADVAERDRLARDALTLLTVWGGREQADAGKLHDYANRDWAGLTGGLHRLRWSTYFEELTDALDEGRKPSPVDWFALESRWIEKILADPDTLATEPAGDTYEVAARVHRTLTATSG